MRVAFTLVMVPTNPIQSNSLSDISNFDDADKLEPQEQGSYFIDMSLTSPQAVSFRGPALLSSDASRWTGPLTATTRTKESSQSVGEPAKVIVQILVTPGKKKGEVKVFVADCIGLNAAGNQSCSNIEHRFIANPPDRVRVTGTPQFEEWDIGKNDITMTDKPTIPPITPLSNEELSDKIEDNQTPVPTDDEFLQDLGKTESEFSKDSKEKSIPIVLEAANQFRSKNGYPPLTKKDVTSGFRLSPPSPGHITGHFDYSTKKLPNLDARLAEAKYVSKALGASMQYIVEEKTPDGKQMNYLFVNGVQVKTWSGGGATATHADVGQVMKTAPVEIKQPSENAPKNNQDPAKEKQIAQDMKTALENKNPINANDPSVSPSSETEESNIIQGDKESNPSKIAKVNLLLKKSGNGDTYVVESAQPQDQNTPSEVVSDWVKNKNIIIPDLNLNSQPEETISVPLEINIDNIYSADNKVIVDGDTKIGGPDDGAITSEKENLQKEIDRIDKEKETKRKAEEEKRRQEAERKAEEDRIKKEAEEDVKEGDTEGDSKSDPSGPGDDPSNLDDNSGPGEIQGDDDDNTTDPPEDNPPFGAAALGAAQAGEDAGKNPGGTVEQVEIPDGPDDPEVGSGGMDPETEEK